MDKSETNIKMCEKAEEIQALAPLAFGELYAYLRPKKGIEWAYDKPQVELIRLNEDGEPCHLFTDDIERCWLPTQDRLQEMVGINPLDLDRFRNFIGDMENNHRDSWNTGVWLSWERLWLAFVMKERYSKIWNGEEWIKS